jgi:hypothetical protein
MMALHAHRAPLPPSSSHYHSTESEDTASPNNVPATQKSFPFNNHNQIFSSTPSYSITAEDLKPISFTSLNFYLSREIKSSHNDRTLRDLWNGIEEAGGHITGDVHHICSDLVFVLPHFKGVRTPSSSSFFLSSFSCSDRFHCLNFFLILFLSLSLLFYKRLYMIPY